MAKSMLLLEVGSALEMRMVRVKEKAMGEQQAVFQRELDEGAAQAQARETALRGQWEAEKRELQALVEKEGEEYRHVIADLRGSLAAKDAETARAQMEKHIRRSLEDMLTRYRE